MNAQPMPDDEYEPKSFLSRAKNWFFGADDQEEEEPEPGATSATTVAPNARKQQHPLRLQTARLGRVAVRRNAQVFEDAKAAADGLKMGEQQIVNLERATPQMAERIIDFLNGVCYALDGTVERVGDRVYMFVPANVAVEVDEGVNAPNPAPRRTNFGE